MNATLGFITAGLQYGLNSILIKPKRSIGAFTAQVTLEEIHTDTLEITEHPVEQGAAISDHAYKRPAEVIIKAMWSNSPSVQGLLTGLQQGIGSTIEGVQSIITGNDVGQVRDLYEKLLKMQADRIPFEVYTGKRVYRDMLVQSLVVPTDAQTENSLMVTATLRQVIIVQTQTITVSAPPSAQADPASTATTVDSGTRQLVPTDRFDPASAGAGP